MLKIIFGLLLAKAIMKPLLFGLIIMLLMDALTKTLLESELT